MQIQRLEICNIASIEKAAIDFTQPPLNNSDVFLITGETGAGKTTILDSICLALFNTTPRLSKGSYIKVQNNDDNLTLNDSRQLMRRDTGWAYVKLDFIGIDGCEYQAYWSVQRGTKKKATSAMDPIEWSLENITGKKTYTGRGNKCEDVKDAVSKAVGLDFAQFCRTTMLAQGEFTEFLKSDEAKKAEILEKIADFSEYRRIGQRVHEIYTAKKKLKERAEKAAQDNGLSEEQLKELKKRIEDLEEEIKGVDNEIQTRTTKRDWIKTNKDLETEKDKISQDYNDAVQATTTDEYKKHNADIHDWRSTIQVRANIDAWNKALLGIERQNQEIVKISNDYSELLGAVEFNRQKLEESNKLASELKTWIDGHSANDKVYANSQTLTLNLEQIGDYRFKIELENKNIKDKEELIQKKLEPEREQADKALEKAKEEYKKLGDDIEKLQKEVEGLQLQELRDEKTKVAGIPSKVETAKDYIEQWKQDIKAYKERVENHNKKFEEIQYKKEQYDGQKQPIIEAQVKANTLEEVYKKQLTSIDDWAREARRNLKEGDVCPVCRQSIGNELPHEDILSNLVQESRDNFNNADEKYKNLVQEHNKLEAEIKGLEKVYKKDDQDIKDDQSVSRSARRVRSAVAEFVITISEDVTDEIPSDISAQLDSVANNAQERLSQLEEQIRKGKDKEDKLKEMRQKQTSLQNKINDILTPDFNRKKDSVQEAVSNIDKYKNNIQTFKEQLENAEGVVTKYLERDVWDKDPKSYAKKLGEDAALYHTNTQKYNELKQDINGLKQSQNLVSESQKQATASLPQLKVVGLGTVKQIDDLPVKMTGIASSAVTAATLKKQNEKILTEKKPEIDSFLNENSSISMERLNELNSYSQQQISVMENSVKGINEKVNDKKRDLKNVSDRIDKHNESKPELSDDDTLDSLNASIGQLTDKNDKNKQKLGADKKELEEDDKKKKQQGEKVKKAKKASQEYERWASLDSLIGNPDGKKFMIIAQCYLMDSLLDSANQYLKKLAPRYKLLSVPEKLYLSVEDSYQGYATRSTDSLSGGEGFLVSLALALALADVGQSLAVDTLFIDEGFGTLSGTPLTNAINTLRTLHSHAGRHVGIISHLRDVKESISTQILVKQEGTSSCSTIEII